MIQVTDLTEAGYQETSVVLADGTTATLKLAFRPATQHWDVSVSREGKVINGVEVTLHPNLLRAYRNTLPFGLACTSKDGVDPFDPADFSSGRVTLYVLDDTGGLTDVEDVESNVFTPEAS